MHGIQLIMDNPISNFLGDHAPDRIATLDGRIFGAHILPHKNILATTPEHIDFVKLQGKMMLSLVSV